ncbi:MAG: serine/threonine protein kinase, partial [Planctomycetota bacterium]
MQGLSAQEVLFAKIALEQGVLSKEGLEKCLAYKRQNPKGLSLEELLIQLRLLSVQEIQKLRKIYYARVQSKTTVTREDLEDNIFGRLVLQRGLATKEEVTWAIARQKQMEAAGIFRRLGEILVEAKILTPYQVQQVLEYQHKKILICPYCHSQYNIENAKPGKQYQCLKCKKILESPSQTPPPSVSGSIYDFTPPPTPTPTPTHYSSRSSVSSSSFPGDQEDTILAQPSQVQSKSDLVQSYNPKSSVIHHSGPSISRIIEQGGTIFGRYEILEKIARGGMGVVYKAKDLSLDRIVALKTLIAGENASQEVIKRFLVEAKAAAKIRHPNIVAIHEIGNAGGQYFFTMDYIEGQPFSQYIKKNPPPQKVAEIMVKVCEAMAYAHAQGIIHRDIKPSNIIIDTSGNPQIMDFGLAKEVESETDLTRTGATIGTPSYMSPEQAAGYNDQVDHLSDVYSLGAVLYEACTFHKPFEGPTSMSIIYKVISQEPPLPHKKNPHIPKDLETIILKAMEKEKAHRYQSAQEMADDLKRFLDGEPVLAKPTGPIYRFWKKIKKHPVTMATLALLFILLASIGIVAVISHRKGLEKQRLLEAKSLLEEAKREYDLGRLLEAQKKLKKVLEKSKNFPETFYLLGRIYRTRHEYLKCEKILLQGKMLHPDSSYILFEMG